LQHLIQKPIKGRRNVNGDESYQLLGLIMELSLSYFECSKCHDVMEIWSDNSEAPCPNGGTVVSKSEIKYCLD